MPRTLLAVALLLVGALGVLIIVFLSNGGAFDGGAARDLSMNLMAEVAGIAATVLAIDRLMKAHEEAERRKVRELALRSLRVPLIRHTALLVAMQKAAAATLPVYLPTAPRLLFEQKFFADLRHLNLAGPAPINPPMPWWRYVPAVTRDFQGALTRCIERYGMALESELLTLLEELQSSTFVSVLADCEPLGTHWPGGEMVIFAAPGMEAFIRQHTDRFAELVARHDEVQPTRPVPLEEYLWGATQGPALGSSRGSGNPPAGFHIGPKPPA